MNWIQGVMLGYGVISIALGAYGYAKSPVSLYMGGLVGLLIIAAAALSKTNPRVGYIGAALISLVMIGNFGGKIMKPDPAWHHIVLTILSVILLASLLAGHFMAKAKSRQNEVPPEPSV